MTYKEKYTELYKNVEDSLKALEATLKALSEIREEHTKTSFSEYQQAQRSFQNTICHFDNLLIYLKNGNIDPNTEYIDKEFMYEFIKADQKLKGIHWENSELNPWQPKKYKIYECIIGLTNDNTIKTDFQSTTYIFTALNLDHGKECYQYLADRLQYQPENKADVASLKFLDIDGEQPVFVKVKMRIS